MGSTILQKLNHVITVVIRNVYSEVRCKSEIGVYIG